MLFIFLGLKVIVFIMISFLMCFFVNDGCLKLNLKGLW